MSLFKFFWKGFWAIVIFGILWETFGGLIVWTLRIAFVCGVIYIGYNCYELYKENH